MSSFSIDQLLNSTLIQTILLYVNHIPTLVSESAVLFDHKESLNFVAEIIPNSLHLEFDEFQLTLLYTFTLILLVNIILICIAWTIFGKSICERFMKPATSKAIEELKASVSRLKLPKEHTPRI